MKQQYYSYLDWEDWKAGMYSNVPKSQEQDSIKKAIEFTGNAKLYGSWMLKVIEKWPIACAQNLTNPSINQQAWVGHAACCMAIKCPEHITRMAWAYLTQQQQDDANDQADIAIEKWKKQYFNQVYSKKWW